jgi:hypothetical protein
MHWPKSSVNVDIMRSGSCVADVSAPLRHTQGAVMRLMINIPRPGS